MASQVPPKDKEEAEPPLMKSLEEVFDETWEKFVFFIKEHAMFLDNPEQEDLLKRGIDRAPELALVTLMQKLTPEIMKMIGEQDIGGLAKLLPSGLQIDLTKFPQAAITRAFRFGDVFCMIISKLRQ